MIEGHRDQAAHDTEYREGKSKLNGRRASAKLLPRTHRYSSVPTGLERLAGYVQACGRYDGDSDSPGGLIGAKTASQKMSAS